MTVTEALQARRAVPSFDPNVEISHAELEALIDLACLAPSSMNLQPWEFLICTTPEDKARMQSVAMNQKKVSEASAVIAVLCNLEFYKHAEAIVDSQIEKGYAPAENREASINQIHTIFSNPKPSRDEAIRSCNLWAMSFMLLAQEAGWNTGPMGGFFADKLSEEFHLPESHFPVILITIGKINPTVNLLPRNKRFTARELSHYGNW